MLFNDLTRTATPPEVAWTVIGLVALLVNLGLTRNAWQDYAALIRLDKNGARRIAARTAVTIQAGLTAPQAIAVTIGVIAMLTPPTNPGKPIAPPVLMVMFGLIAIEIILVWVGLYTHVRRRLLLNYLNGLEESAGATRHAEAMTELVHNTELTTEARDGVQDAYHVANNLNSRMLEVQQDIAATNLSAGDAATAAKQSTDKLRDLMEKLEGERVDRAEDEKGGC